MSFNLLSKWCKSRYLVNDQGTKTKHTVDMLVAGMTFCQEPFTWTANNDDWIHRCIRCLSEYTDHLLLLSIHTVPCYCNKIEGTAVRKKERKRKKKKKHPVTSLISMLVSSNESIRFRCSAMFAYKRMFTTLMRSDFAMKHTYTQRTHTRRKPIHNVVQQIGNKTTYCMQYWILSLLYHCISSGACEHRHTATE